MAGIFQAGPGYFSTLPARLAGIISGLTFNETTCLNTLRITLPTFFARTFGARPISTAFANIALQKSAFDCFDYILIYRIERYLYLSFLKNFYTKNRNRFRHSSLSSLTKINTWDYFTKFARASGARKIYSSVD